MPCYRCGTRQVDPDRGESPWQRGVRGDRQVLVCPACQVSFDWRADLDHCPVCASLHLVRRLGETECRDCGWVRPSAPAGLPGHLAALAPAPARRELEVSDASGVSDLALEVERALAKVLGRTAGSPSRG
ncbi:MAG TPA: hypothetical protein VGM79_10655 [Streptosporangiaceae bacterium]|jgi:hypothetical protein